MKPPFLRPSKWTAITLAMVCIAATFAFLIWHGVQSDNHQTFQDRQSGVKDRIIAAQQQELKAGNEAAIAAASFAATNTRIFERNQQKMLAFVVALRNQQAAVLRWVKAHPGQPIPTVLLDPVPVPTLQPIRTATKKAVPPKSRARKGNAKRK